MRDQKTSTIIEVDERSPRQEDSTITGAAMEGGIEIDSVLKQSTVRKSKKNSIFSKTAVD